ncbi:DUF1501 domain-containing protein [Planctomicrobium sp. SH668]|uniref:DUF1501 domain-containing protein n=1 Tax=Planctomicrobium sp. SH668 TaxID=3448126 RepID=UPI003F5B1664
MLSILGQPLKFCDSLSRRAFLQVGGLAMGGASLSQILKAEESQGISGNKKGIIMIFLPGGPPHQDLWDLKPAAPSNIRGEFSPIQTRVPGMEICELLPRLASCADKFSIIRSIVGNSGDHASFQCMTGHLQQQQPTGGWPALGSVLAKQYGPRDPAIPPYIGLSPKMGHMPWADNGQPGFLGRAYAPFTPAGDGKENLQLNGVTLERLQDRKRVLASLDRLRSSFDSSGRMRAHDAFHDQAFGILTSSKLATALDNSLEPIEIQERYGYGEDKKQDDGGSRLLTPFLTARRLIEAGVRCVSMSFSRWDWHHDNFGQSRRDFPMLDQALSALIEDLDQRGMLNDVSVIVWGEFGRTPQINADGGRDHWPQVNSALIAGGGMRHGQVIGATDRLGGSVSERPIHMQEVFATLYKSLGIDVNQTTFPDLQGRPQFLVDHTKYQPIAELA